MDQFSPKSTCGVDSRRLQAFFVRGRHAQCMSTRTAGFVKTAILAAVFPAPSTTLECRFGLARGKIGNHRFAGNRDLPFAGQNARAFGEVYVDTRSEADHADTLAGAKAVTFTREANDPARDQAGDLNDGKALAAAGDDDESVSLVVLARFVEVGADEFAGAIDDALDASGDRAAIDVAVEHAHEDRDARQRPFAEFKLARRDHVHDLTDAAVRRRHHDLLSDRRYARRIAKKIYAPQRRDHAQPAKRRPYPEQNEGRHGKAGDERITFAVNWRQLLTN